MGGGGGFLWRLGRGGAGARGADRNPALSLPARPSAVGSSRGDGGKPSVSSGGDMEGSVLNTFVQFRFSFSLLLPPRVQRWELGWIVPHSLGGGPSPEPRGVLTSRSLPSSQSPSRMAALTVPLSVQAAVLSVKMEMRQTPQMPAAP